MQMVTFTELQLEFLVKKFGIDPKQWQKEASVFNTETLLESVVDTIQEVEKTGPINLLDIAKSIKKTIKIGKEIKVWSYDVETNDFVQKTTVFKPKTNISYEVQKFFTFNEAKAKGGNKWMDDFKRQNIIIPEGDYTQLFEKLKNMNDFVFVIHLVNIKNEL